MSDSGKSTEIASHYSCNIQKRFKQKNGKLFLVDYDKAAALDATIDLVSLQKSAHTLVIVENAAAALEFSQRLSDTAHSFHVIQNMEQMQAVLKKAAFSASDKDGFSKQLKSLFPHLIVAATDEHGNTLLHHTLTVGSDKASSFAGSDKKAPFCFSDALAKCAYDFVIIDNIYAMLSFEQCEPDQPLPLIEHYDHVNFLGDSYFSSTAYSHKRLKNIVASCASAVILSDVIAKNDAVALYVVLDMIEPAFSMQTARTQIMKLCPEYLEHCETICTDVSYCKDDELVLGSCLQKAGANGQHVPFDIDSLKEYFSLCLSYMSEEEIFLRVIDAYTRVKKHSFQSIDILMQTLTSDVEEMALCLTEIFFRDTLKGELESVLSTPKICQFTDKQAQAVITGFLSKGVYHCFGNAEEALTVLRFKKDVSGFEHYVRSLFPCAADDGNTFTLLYPNDTWIYKTVALRGIVTAGNGEADKFPLVIVCDTRTPQLRDAIKQILPDATVHDTIEAFCADTKTARRILLANEQSLRDTALAVRAHTVVFFDIPHNVVTQKLLLHKLHAYQNTTLYIMAGYDFLEGNLLDSWHELLLGSGQALPFENCELCLKEGSLKNYTEIVCTLDALYHHLQTFITSQTEKQIDDFSVTYNKALLDMTLQVTSAKEDIAQDIKYLTSAGTYFEAIFANTASTDDSGMEAVSRSYHFLKNPELITQITEQKQTQTTRKQLFEVCPKLLLGVCNVHKQSCADCDDYKRFTINSTATLKSNLQKFFDKTKEFAELLEQKRMQARAAATINSSDDEENSHYLTREKVEKYQQQAMQAMEAILTEKKRFPATFVTDYDTVKALRHAVTKTFNRVLGQYFTTIVTIFKTATEQAKNSFAVGCNGFDSAYNGQ